MRRIPIWRPLFALSGIAMILGGPRHPSPRLDLSFEASTAVMLANPEWVPAHTLLLVSYVLLGLALTLWRRASELPPRVDAWARFTLLALILAIVEMAFHTAAVLDRGRLEAGQSTPILTAHLWLAFLANPLLTIGLVGLALQAARHHLLGSKWIAWLPIGGLAYGAATVYVISTHDQRVSPLFAIGSAFLALWFILVAVWPVRPRARVDDRAHVIRAM